MRLRVFLLTLAAVAFLSARPFAAETRPLRPDTFVHTLSGWQYRWGDVTNAPGQAPSWAVRDLDSPEWKNTSSCYNIPGRLTNSSLWLRTVLPDGLGHDAVLFIPGADLYLEVYLGKTLLYRTGKEGNLLTGFVWHEVGLPDGASGQTVFFRFRSPLDTIGFTGDRILAGNRSEVILDIIRGSLDKFILGFVFIALGIASVIFFISKINQRAFLSFGFFNIFLGTFTIAQTQMKQLFLGADPVVWAYIDLLSLYTLPAFAISFAKEILRVFRKRAVYWTWVVSIVFAVGMIPLSVIVPNMLMIVLPGFKVAILAAIAVVLTSSVRSWIRGNTDARIFTIGFAILSVFAVSDILQELRIIPRTVYLTHWGLFGFVLTVGAILIGKIIVMYNQLKGYSEELEEKNIIVNQTINQLEKLYEEIEFTQKEVILRLSEITEARSKETGNHVRRVAEYSRILALATGLPQQEVDIIKLAAPMHDIGKLAIPDSILMKPDKLTGAEFEIIKTHTITGYEMLRKSKREIFGAAAIIAHEHHERFDGEGYPRRLKGTDIHIYGRITAVADVFDSLASDRCYKKAWELDKVLEFMNENRRSHFDPALIDALFDNLELFVTIRDKYRDEYTGE